MAAVTRVLAVVMLAGCLSKPEPPPGAACTAFGPWGTSKPLSTLNTATAELGPWLSADRTEIWYSVNGKIQRARRSDPTQDFGQIEDMTSQLPNDGAVPDYDAAVFLANGGRDLWFDHMQGTQVIVIVHRSMDGVPFSDSQYASVSADGMTDTYDPALSQDELTLVYALATNQMFSDLWMATRRTVNDPWMPGKVLVNLNTASDDSGPTLSADANELWFSSEQSGAYKLYHAQRAGAGMDFAGATELDGQVGDANTDNTEPAVSFDGRSLIYSSGRMNGVSHLYEMQRDCQ